MQTTAVKTKKMLLPCNSTVTVYVNGKPQWISSGPKSFLIQGFVNDKGVFEFPVSIKGVKNTGYMNPTLLLPPYTPKPEMVLKHGQEVWIRVWNTWKGGRREELCIRTKVYNYSITSGFYQCDAYRPYNHGGYSIIRYVSAQDIVKLINE